MRKTRNYLNRNFNKERDGDLLSDKKRSERMSKIRSTNTKLEQKFIILLRKATRKKFKTNLASIKGKPDIVFQEERICVFLDSDFWHGWYYPRWKHLLKNDFWRHKIERNRRRDRLTTDFLRKNHWHVIRIWEHDLKKEGRALEKVINGIKHAKN